VKVKEAFAYLLEKLSQIEDPYFAKKEAREILAHLLNLSPLEIYLYPEKEVAKEDLERILKERLTLKPLPYILKKVYFFGRAFYLEEGVLIPRQESEILVEVILNIIRERRLKDGTLLELGCGSGVLSITLLLEEKSLRVFANDISDTALRVTRENAKMHKVVERLRLLKGDFLSPFKKKPLFHLIFSNPPYLSHKEWEALDPEVKLFEPKEALLSGIQGTEFQEILIKEASFYLKEGGFLIFEMGYNQSQRISELAKAFNWKYQFFRDLLGYERVALLWRENI
jgi:release factor glutamine methyltransferase